MRVEYDPQADAVYIYLRDVPYSYGYTLDLSRRVDYGEDRRPMGVELLDVSRGVDLRSLPEADLIAMELRRHDIPVAA